MSKNRAYVITSAISSLSLVIVSTSIDLLHCTNYLTFPDGSGIRGKSSLLILENIMEGIRKERGLDRMYTSIR